MEQEVSYAQEIRPLFRDRDIQSMSFAFDLSSYEDVRANAEAIHEKLADGSMPCDGRWPDEQIERFRTWIDQGSKPCTSPGARISLEDKRAAAREGADEGVPGTPSPARVGITMRDHVLGGSV